MDPRIAIEVIAEALGDLKERCFLTGGMSIPFYITDPLEEPPRATLDIDVVVEVYSTTEYYNVVETRLRERGFVNDMTPGAPNCRWRWQEFIVDVMPTEESVLGFTNPWYREGLSHTIPITVTQRCAWRVLSSPFALAAKLTAFWTRGSSDPMRSQDLEDIITLINGRVEIVQEISTTQEMCKQYVLEALSKILNEERFLDALPSHLPYGDAGQQRLPIVLARMRQITGL